MSEPFDITQTTVELKAYINGTPELLSLLYDLDLMPEQVRPDTQDWFRMLMIASWHKTKSESLSP